MARSVLGAWWQPVPGTRQSCVPWQVFGGVLVGHVPPQCSLFLVQMYVNVHRMSWLSLKNPTKAILFFIEPPPLPHGMPFPVSLAWWAKPSCEMLSLN